MLFRSMLAELGYGFAYRVLDAQYFGVAQRRRRVFVVGHLGEWRRAAAVLFERHSLSGHPAPRREAGEGSSGRAAASVAFRGRDGGAAAEVGDDCAFTLRASGGGGDKPHALTWPAEVACTLNAAFGSKQGLEDQHALSGASLFVPATAHSLRGEGFDASEDGTGRGTPLVPVPFDTTQITSAANYSRPKPGDPCHPLAAGAHAPAIAFPWQLGGTMAMSHDVDLCGTLVKNQTQAVALALRGREGGATAEVGDDCAFSLRASTGGGDKPHVMAGMAVRRLTPRECERLQGFPDDYTLIPWRTWQEAARKGASYEGLLHERGMTLRGPSLEECPDGPRYKALGNSMAVPVMRWIGERIDQASAIRSKREAA